MFLSYFLELSSHLLKQTWLLPCTGISSLYWDFRLRKMESLCPKAHPFYLFIIKVSWLPPSLLEMLCFGYSNSWAPGLYWWTLLTIAHQPDEWPHHWPGNNSFLKNEGALKIQGHVLGTQAFSCTHKHLCACAFKHAPHQGRMLRLPAFWLTGILLERL